MLQTENGIGIISSEQGIKLRKGARIRTIENKIHYLRNLALYYDYDMEERIQELTRHIQTNEVL